MPVSSMRTMRASQVAQVGVGAEQVFGHAAMVAAMRK
jgi:hypothetical protein